MSESEQTATISKNETPIPTAEEMAERMCHGLWKLKPSVVLRVEDDGAILFDPDTDRMLVTNLTGRALLAWRPERISFTEWSEALHEHYGTKVDMVQIRADVKNFLGMIAFFVESPNGQDN